MICIKCNIEKEDLNFTDWEVAGKLVDYDGEVTATFKNRTRWPEKSVDDNER